MHDPIIIDRSTILMNAEQIAAYLYRFPDEPFPVVPIELGAEQDALEHPRFHLNLESGGKCVNKALGLSTPPPQN